MQALVYEGARVMTLRDVDVPDVGPDDVLIRVAYSGICGSELSGFLGTNSLRTPPLVFGHEFAGSIEAVGSAVDPTSGLCVGAEVTANPLVSCGNCRYCVTGRQQLCPERRLLGAHLPGCNAELVVVPARSVLLLPSGMALRDAATVEPAACAVHAVSLSGIGPDATALVYGAGPIGLFLLQVLEQHGVSRRYVAELNPARLDMARALGAIPVTGPDDVLERAGGIGVDVAFDAVGSASTRQECLAGTAPGGQVIAVGLHTDETTLSINTIVRSETVLRGAFAYSAADFRTALAWLGEGRIGLRDGIVEADLADGQDWYTRLVAGDSAAKVLLRPGAAR
jgi:2-desacetyl-2-hydroxyethyl bacteriochlorophyllide A dehydrogenase